MIIHAAYLSLTQWKVPTAWIQKPLSMTGKISSVPVPKFRGEQFQFQTTEINHQSIHTILLLNWYQNSPMLRADETWQFKVSLKPPVGTHNPGEFDYAAFLQHQGITGVGTIKSGRLLKNASPYALNYQREEIQKNIETVVSNPVIAAFLSALSVGLRSGLPEQDWQVFQKTGTNHLIAIAGLHIGFVVLIFYGLSNRCWRLSARLLLFCPAQIAAEIIAFVCASLYAVLSGLALPAERTIIMLFFFVIAKSLYRFISLWQRLFFAIVVIIISNPYTIFDDSFWLSIMSIGWIAWILQGRLQKSGHIKSLLKMQIGIVVGLIPLMALFFQQISVAALFANAVAIPWVGLIILPLVLMALSSYFLHLHCFSQALFCYSGKLLMPLWLFLKYVSQLSFASFHWVIFQYWILFFALIGLIFLLAPRYFPLKKYGIFGLLPLFFYQPHQPKLNHFWVNVIDVGQGLSVLVQTAHHAMLYDTGARYPDGFDFGESVVAPYLRLQNIHVIDRLEISHGDNDHSGGMSAILNNFTVKNIFTSAPNLVKQFQANYCRAGQQWQWDGVIFTTLNPLSEKYEDNNSSCVIKIDNGDQSILLTGDIEAATEALLVQQYGPALKSSVLLSPHHGSQTSSTENFLKAVSPKMAVISSGKYNVYHLPSKSTLTRYKDDHIVVLNTANAGRVRLRFGKRVTLI